MDIRLLDNTVLPKGFKYPESFLKAIELGLTNFDCWYMINSRRINGIYHGLKDRYPKRILVPFAERKDNDDIACFELNKGEEVQIIHDYASFGWEQRNTYKSFWEWFRYAIEEMIMLFEIEVGSK